MMRQGCVQRFSALDYSDVILFPPHVIVTAQLAVSCRCYPNTPNQMSHTLYIAYIFPRNHFCRHRDSKCRLSSSPHSSCCIPHRSKSPDRLPARRVPLPCLHLTTSYPMNLLDQSPDTPGSLCYNRSYPTHRLVGDPPRNCPMLVGSYRPLGS